MLLPFAVLAAVPFVMVLGNSMLIPVFPRMEAEMNLTQFQVGLLVTAFSVPAGILIPFAGALSDYIGRKRIMAPALILYGLGGLIAGSAALLLDRPFALILAGRIVQGIGAGGTYQIALALTGDVFTSGERTKAVGLLEAANGTGKVVSPILGSLFALISWFAPFFAYGILSIPIAIAVWLIVKEPEKEREQRPIAQYTQALKGIFAKKGVGLGASYLAGMTGLFLLFGLLSFLSDELEGRFNIRDFAKGFVLAIPVLTMAVTSYVTGLFLQGKREWLKPAIVGGLVLTGGSFFVLTLVDGLIPMMIFISIIGLGIGATLPPINTLVTGATNSSERGLVTSLYGTVRFFGVAMGPPLFGLVVGMGRLPMFVGATVIAAISAAAALFLIKPKQIIIPPEEREGGNDSNADSPNADRPHRNGNLKNGVNGHHNSNGHHNGNGAVPRHVGESGETSDKGKESDTERVPEPSPR